MKSDQGFKPLLRGIRSCLIDGFISCGFAEGKYRWSDQELASKTKEYLRMFPSELLRDPSDSMIWGFALLIFPVKGNLISKKEGKKGQPECQPLFDALGKEGINTFKSVFLNNN